MHTFKTYMMSMLAVGSMAFLSSCGSDEDDPEPQPSIEFVAGTGLTNANATVTGGTSFTTGVIARSNSSGRNLRNFKVTVSYDGGAAQTQLDTTVNTEN